MLMGRTQGPGDGLRSWEPGVVPIPATPWIRDKSWTSHLTFTVVGFFK